MSPERRRNHLVWIGPLVTVAGALSYFYVFVPVPALRDFPWVNLPLVLLGLAASALGVWRAFARREVFGGRLLAPLGFALSLLLAAAFSLYIFRISYFVPAPTATAMGLDQAPDFALASMTGDTVRLSELRSRKVVLIFYRGHW